jgi:excisionase family DNA binding protein
MLGLRKSFRQDFRKTSGGRASYASAMPRASDVYTAAQAAQILGISERRVRQLVTEGKLPGERGDDNIVRIPQQAVTEERKRRRKTDGGGGAKATRAQSAGAASKKTKTSAQTMDVEELADKVATAVGNKITGQLEITQKAESLLRSELDEERAKRMQSDAQLTQAQNEAASLKARLAEVEAQLQQAQQKKGLFRR